MDNGENILIPVPKNVQIEILIKIAMHNQKILVKTSLDKEKSANID